MLKRKIKFFKDELSKFEKRESEIIEEIKSLNDEIETGDVTELSKRLDELEKEKEEIEKNKEKTQDAITLLEEEQKEIEENKERETQTMEKLTLRNKINALMKNETINTFYEEVRTALTQRGVANGKITVPTEIVDLVSELVKEESVMLKHVRQLNLNGNGKIVLPGVIEDAVWVEYGTGLESAEKQLSVTAIDIEAHKLGAFIILPNDFEKDSAVNLGEYVTKALATGMARALDKAIINGDGTNKPKGIITATNASNKVTLAKAKQGIADIVAEAAKIDKKGDTAPLKVFVKPSTNFGKILPLVINNNADGRVVALIDKFPATSWEVVECEAIPENTILIGLANQYVLAQREGVTIENSKDFKFISDATVFRGLGRYDGKLANDKAFVVLTLAA